MKIKHLCSRSHAEFTECGAEPWFLCVLKAALWCSVLRVWFPVGSTAGHLFIRSDDELTVRTCLICSTLLIKAYFELCGEKKNTQTFLRLRWWRQHYYDYCKKWNKNIRLLQCLFNVKIIKSPQNGVCFNFGRVIFTQDEENKAYFQSCLNYVFTNMSTSLREHEDNLCYSTCP